MEHMENDTEKYTTAKCQREVIKKKVKLSRYTPCRHIGGEEVQLLLILNKEKFYIINKEK
jgi:hypothetical protein